MATTATHNITVPENYKKDGEDKTRWNNIGVILKIEKDGRTRNVIKLNSIPLGWDGFANIFPIDKNRGKTAVDQARDEYNQENANPDADINQERNIANDPMNEPVDLSDIPF